MMVFQGQVIGQPYKGGRDISDIIYFGGNPAAVTAAEQESLSQFLSGGNDAHENVSYGVFPPLHHLFSGVFITLAILNQYNPGMGFLTSGVSLVFILGFCLSVVALAVATIADNRRYAHHMRQKAEEAARWKKIGVNTKRPPHRGE